MVEHDAAPQHISAVDDDVVPDHDSSFEAAVALETDVVAQHHRRFDFAAGHDDDVHAGVDPVLGPVPGQHLVPRRVQELEVQLEILIQCAHAAQRSRTAEQPPLPEQINAVAPLFAGLNFLQIAEQRLPALEFGQDRSHDEQDFAFPGETAVLVQQLRNVAPDAGAEIVQHERPAVPAPELPLQRRIVVVVEQRDLIDADLILRELLAGDRQRTDAAVREELLAPPQRMVVRVDDRLHDQYAPRPVKIAGTVLTRIRQSCQKPREAIYSLSSWTCFENGMSLRPEICQMQVSPGTTFSRLRSSSV